MQTIFTQFKSFFATVLQQSNKLLILVDQVVVSGGNFVLGLVLVRLLGLENYGLFALLWMGVLFALSLHQAYITKPLMTLAVAKEADAQQNYFHVLWRIQLIGGGGVVLLLVFLSSLLKWSGVAIPWLIYVPMVSCLSFFYLLQDFIKKTFFIKGIPIKPLLMDCWVYGWLFLGLFLSFWLEKSNLQLTILLLLSGYAISSLLFCQPLFQKNKTIAVPAWRQLVSEHYHFSNWLLGTSILQWFSGNFFLIAAASTLGTTAVGAVRIGQNIVGLCHLLFLAMENIVPVEAAQHFLENGKTALVNYLKTICWKGGGLVILLLTALGIIAPWLIALLYGSEYVEYSFVVWAFCGLYFFVFLGYPARYFFRTLKFTKPIFIAYCLGAAFSLLAAYPMVEAWGIYGVLVGLIISQLLTLGIYTFFIERKLKTIDKELVEVANNW